MPITFRGLHQVGALGLCPLCPYEKFLTTHIAKSRPYELKNPYDLCLKAQTICARTQPLHAQGPLNSLRWSCRFARLETHEPTGSLYGLMYDGVLLVVGFSLEVFGTEKNLYKKLLLHLPAEIELCGVLKFGKNLTTDSRLKEMLQDVDITDNPIIIMVNDKKEIKAHFLVHDKLEETSYEVLSMEEMKRQFLYVRLSTLLPLHCEATIPSVKNVLQSKREKLLHKNESADQLGHVPSNAIGENQKGAMSGEYGEWGRTSHETFPAADVGLTGVTADATVGEVLDSISAEQPPKKKKYFAGNVDMLHIKLGMKATKDILSDKLVKTAVKVMTTQRKPAYCINMPLDVDGVTMVHRNTKVVELYTVLVETACRSIKLLESSLVEQLGQEGLGDGAGLKLPLTHHFLPTELGHFFTRILPKDFAEENMEKERRTLHKQLGLPMDWPVFRRACAYRQHTFGKLVNPHEALPPLVPQSDVVVALVRGRYDYYHYMQDNMNDDGWGYQGYCDPTEIPNLRDIQHCLVDIGDKPSSFLGSKQWIGSTEVMFCLETWYGIQSRIIFVNSGAELQTYAVDLINHFQKHGSPIMIGGGVLAHTILGVEYNTVTNSVRYLILDPHYTGVDDLSVVVSKGWCGWKNSDFWKKTAHYNLCLPQTKPCI
ncbi:Probable Ufm1-specific protease 2 [Eumeta japonica]|uniref:Probable Ufm1-specific protease 2 n=1 Tax=Eumeta variegata TaxID=151549 RepID=A0A4C1VA79_EUMVA|nr:Probable Ufm1-specific protease 2 [Eumeta japonica]